MQKITFIFYSIIFFALMVTCDDQSSQNTQNDTEQTSSGRNIPPENELKIGVGIIALHPNYAKDTTAFFELYLNEKLEDSMEVYNPLHPEAYKRAKPKYFDAGKGITYLVCLGWKPGSYKVVINDETGEEMHLPEDSTRYVHIEWGAFIKESQFISRINSKENPIRRRSGDKGDILEWEMNEERLEVITTYEQFAKVKNPTDTTQSGWIRWAKHNKLLVDIEPVLIDSLLLSQYEFKSGNWEIKNTDMSDTLTVKPQIK